MGQIRGAEAAYTSAAIVVPTTTETVAIVSPKLDVQSPTQRFCVLAWAQITTGAATATLTPRVRRGIDATGVLLGTAIAEGIYAPAAAETEARTFMIVDQPGNLDSVQYAFTLQQGAATGNGSIIQASILVLAL